MVGGSTARGLRSQVDSWEGTAGAGASEVMELYLAYLGGLPYNYAYAITHICPSISP